MVVVVVVRSGGGGGLRTPTRDLQKPCWRPATLKGGFFEFFDPIGRIMTYGASFRPSAKSVQPRHQLSLVSLRGKHPDPGPGQCNNVTPLSENGTPEWPVDPSPLHTISTALAMRGRTCLSPTFHNAALSQGSPF